MKVEGFGGLGFGVEGVLGVGILGLEFRGLGVWVLGLGFRAWGDMSPFFSIWVNHCKAISEDYKL